MTNGVNGYARTRTMGLGGALRDALVKEQCQSSQGREIVRHVLAVDEDGEPRGNRKERRMTRRAMRRAK